MTAPQHDAKPPSQQQKDSQPTSSQVARYQKLQRCWFIGMGLLGGFGFVTSQMSFALAETEFLVNDASQPAEAGDLASADDFASDSWSTDDYTGSDYASNDYVADTYVADAYAAEPYAAEPYTQSAADLAPIQPTFSIQAESQPTPEPEAFVEALSTPFEAVESLTAINAEPTYAEPLYAELAPTEATVVEDTVVEAAAVEPATIENAQVEATQTEAIQAELPSQQEGAVSETADSTITLDELRNSAIANSGTPEQSVAAAQQTPGIQIEITPAATNTATGIAPTVTAAATPRFTTPQKPTKVSTGGVSTRQGHPLAGFMEVNAVAAPLSIYARNQVTLAMADESEFAAPAAIELAPEPLPEVAPEILPEPAPVAPPIVDIEPIVEAAPPAQPAEVAPIALPESIGVPEDYNGIFVDPTDYSIGATEAPDVVISEQSTGCEFTVGQNQGVPNGACGLPSAPAPVAGSPLNAPNSSTPTAIAPAPSAPAWQEAPAASAPVASAPSVNVGPVSFSASGIQLSTSAAGRDYLNRSVRPLVNLQATKQFIFPLAVPSPITSLFGFRTHPISGDRRFHAGTDIGAEQGTPVLAAQDGVVAAADAAGGYGLMVVLRHQAEDLELESRYAHLAEIFVEAGKEVKKGDIIGLVGSTGNSTGPHLHFEMRQMTADGWVLVNADGLVQASLANLVNALNNPMETLTFNLSDFNLSNLRAKGSIKAPTTSIPTFPVGKDGIPFRPAQPNAS